MEEVRHSIEFGEETLNAGYAGMLADIKRNMDTDRNAVLLIDDEKGIRKKVARDVRTFDPDLAIFEAGNGKEGLERLEEIRAKYSRDPVLIVLDLNMPVMDGWTFIKTLKKEYESQGRATGIPILVLSSTSGEKGGFFGKTTVHDGKAGYEPLVSVAKETCVDMSHYDAKGEKGLMAWLTHFAKT